MILDIWQSFGQGPDVPHLLIIGNKSWAEPAVYAQLAHLAQRGTVTHIQGLPDAAVSAALHGAAGLLFPTLAEGFGLPPIEAASFGTPVIVSDLPVLRETCSTFAVYLDPSDSYSWMETIQGLALRARAGAGGVKLQAPPTWADHFKAVLTWPE
jgi:glycosyltransferase involved in cell wall biosynthesis